MIRLSVLVALALFCAYRVDLSELVQEFSGRIILAGLVMQGPLLVASALYAIRHAILLRDPPVPFRPAFEAIFLSAALNLVLPGRASEAIKATYMRERLGIPLSSGLPAILVERLTDAAVVGCIALFGVAGALGLSFMALVPSVVGLATLLILRPVSQAVIDSASRRPFIESMRRYARHVVLVMRPSIVGRTIGLTVASWLVHFAALWLFFEVQPFAPLTLQQVAMVFSATVFCGAVPALPGGLGLFEAGVVVVLQQVVGYQLGPALALAVGLHAAEIALAATIGPILLSLRSVGVLQLVVDAAAVLRSTVPDR